MNNEYEKLYTVWTEKSVNKEIVDESFVYNICEEDIGFITLKNNLCYILERRRLIVYNTSNLANMTLISSFDLDYAEDMQFEDDRVYILTQTQIDILNISS